MVTREGLPIGYEVFPGATYEGHSLVPVLQDMQRRHQVERTICVADRGMLSADNRYVIPSKPTPAAELIYATMGLPLTITPYQLV